jgi:hypothetical protein
MSHLISFTSSVEELPDGFRNRPSVIDVSEPADDEEGTFEITVDLTKFDPDNLEYIH